MYQRETGHTPLAGSGSPGLRAHRLLTHEGTEGTMNRSSDVFFPPCLGCLCSREHVVSSLLRLLLLTSDRTQTPWRLPSKRQPRVAEIVDRAEGPPAWVQVPACSLTSCMTLNKWHSCGGDGITSQDINKLRGRHR